MPSYFGVFNLNQNIPPARDPNANLEILKMFRVDIKEMLSSGILKEANVFVEGTGGWIVTGDVPEEKIHEHLTKFAPFVYFELHRTIPLEKSLEMSIQNLTKLSKEMVR